MPTPREVVARLFPQGTNPAAAGEAASIERYPEWPPDAFAAAATLAVRSGCYSRPDFITGNPANECREFAERLAADWCRLEPNEQQKQELQDVWQAILTCPSTLGALDDPVALAILKLLAASDDASMSIGFYADAMESPRRLPIALEVLLDQLRVAASAAGAPITKAPHSLCRMVDPNEACVQPKTRVPQLGCTARSLSQNLALLPAANEVLSVWQMGVPKSALQSPPPDHAPFSLLLVPYPYRIDDRSFVPGDLCDPTHSQENPARYFHVDQTWLNRRPPEAMAKFLLDLVDEAVRRGHRVRGIVLPELAISEAEAQPIAQALARRQDLDLELFIAGILGQDTHGEPRNLAYTALLQDGDVLLAWKQSKHHRWRLDPHQIKQYRLEHRLETHGSQGRPMYWWEDISLAGRECRFTVFRRGACLTAIVCEDLARIEPVQPAIRAVGPNLVFSLLMDGPQLERRWSGRYASILADDPGCAVVTLTSLGLIARSDSERVIALWKDPVTGARELRLPNDCHALLLNLGSRYETELTLDGRSCGGNTVGFTLVNHHYLRHESPPYWIDMA